MPYRGGNISHAFNEMYTLNVVLIRNTTAVRYTGIETDSQLFFTICILYEYIYSHCNNVFVLSKVRDVASEIWLG